MLVKNCPACHTDINSDGSVIDLPVFHAFTCENCGEEFEARADLSFQKPGGGRSTINDPRTPEGQAAAAKIKSARATAKGASATK